MKESLSRRSVRTFSVLTVGRALGLLVGVLSIVVIAKLLGPVDYGIFTLAFAFFMLVNATSNFGYGIYLTKHLSEAEDLGDRKAFSSALSAGFLSVIALGFILTLIGIGVSGFVASLFQDQGISSTTLMLASSIVFFSMVYGTADYALIGIGKNLAAVSLEIFENILLLVGSVGLIKLGYGANGAIAGILMSYIVGGALGTYLIFNFAHKEMKAKIDWPTVKELKSAFSFSLPVAANNLLNNGMVSFGTLFLGFFVSTYVLGNYGIAIRANTLLSLFYSTTATALISTLTIAFSREVKGTAPLRFSVVYNKAMVYSIILSMPLIAYLGVFAKPLIYLFISKDFGSAPLYLALISLGTIIGLIGVYATSLFIARSKTSDVLRYSIMSAFVQFIALVALVPFFGPVGAIVALFVIDGFVVDYLFMKGVKEVLKLKTNYHDIAKAFLSNIALAVVFAIGLFIYSDFISQLAFGAAALLVAYPLLLVLFRSIDSDDLHIMREAAQHFSLLRPFFNPMISYFTFLMAHLQ